MSAFFRALTALSILAFSIPFAQAAGPSGAKNLRFLPANPSMAWTAGSKQNVTLEGPAVKAALAIRYRWMDEKSTLLLSGQIPRNGRNEWNGEIVVPLYSAKGTPHLILEVANGRSKTSTFRSGKEFRLPPIKGIVIDGQPPVVASHPQFNSDKAGNWMEIVVQDQSGVAQALVTVGSDKNSQVYEGSCKPENGKTSCVYYIPKDPKGVALTVQITDLAGNRTIASVQKGSKP